MDVCVSHTLGSVLLFIINRCDVLKVLKVAGSCQKDSLVPSQDFILISFPLGVVGTFSKLRRYYADSRLPPPPSTKADIGKHMFLRPESNLKKEIRGKNVFSNLLYFLPSCPFPPPIFLNSPSASRSAFASESRDTDRWVGSSQGRCLTVALSCCWCS